MVFDHAHQRVLAIANEIEGEVSVDEAEKELARLSRLLTEESGGGGVAMPGSPPGRPPPTCRASTARASAAPC